MTITDNQDKPILSDRQIEVLNSASKGLSNQQIAQELHISVNTVRVHLRNIFEKIEVQSRTEAVMWAISSGLIEHSISQADTVASPEDLVTETSVDNEVARPSRQAQETDAYIAPPLTRISSTIVPRLSLWQRLYFVSTLIVALFFLFTPVIRSTLGTNDDGQPLVQFHDRWRVISHMPTSRSGLALAHINNDYYVIGGNRTSGPTGLVEIYNAESDSWREGSGKPTAVIDIQAVTIQDKIYVAGGCTADQQAVDILEIFDPETSLWERGSDLPVPLCGYAATTDGQNLYLIGGWNGTSFVDSIYVFHRLEDRWEKLESAYPHPIGYAATTIVQNQIYVVGGLKDNQEIATVYILNLDTLEWQEGPRLLHPRAGLGLVHLNDTLFAIGGGWTSDLRANEQLLLSQPQWEELSTPYYSQWRNFGITQNGKDIIIAGGWNGDYLSLLVMYEGNFRVFMPILQ